MKVHCPRGLHGAVEPSPPGVYPKCSKCREERNRGKRKRGKARKELRKRVLSRFGNRCAALENGERCWVHGTTLLEIHHVDGDSGNDHPNNLVPCCKPHHRTHAGRPRSAFANPPTPLIA